MKTADLYKKVDEKVDRLLIIIYKLAEKWLPKSNAVRVFEGCCTIMRIRFLNRSSVASSQRFCSGRYSNEFTSKAATISAFNYAYGQGKNQSLTPFPLYCLGILIARISGYFFSISPQ
jgi:hypothetical protein